MFKEVMGLLEKEGQSVTMNVIRLADDTLSVTVLPKGEWKDKALGAGLCLQASAEELDEQFAGLVGKFVSTRKSLAEQVDSTLAVLEEAQRAQKEKAGSAVKKSAVAAKPAAKATPAATASRAEDDDEADDGGSGESLVGAGAPASASADASADAVSLFD